VSTERCGQSAASRIGHGKPLLNRIFVQDEGDLQPERERIDRTRRGILVEHQPACRRAAIQPGETFVAGKAVLTQPVRLSVMTQRVILQPADDREQHRSVTRPDRGGLPHDLPASGIAQRAKLRAIRLDRGRQGPVGHHVPIHHAATIAPLSSD
jgi:hypothetical protein